MYNINISSYTLYITIAGLKLDDCKKISFGKMNNLNKKE